MLYFYLKKLKFLRQNIVLHSVNSIFLSFVILCSFSLIFRNKLHKSSIKIIYFIVYGTQFIVANNDIISSFLNYSTIDYEVKSETTKRIL